MKYPYAYPELYAELARQGKRKTDLAKAIGLSPTALRVRQRKGDFTCEHMRQASLFLECPAAHLFKNDGLEDEVLGHESQHT